MEASELCNIQQTKSCWIGLNRIFGEYEWMDDTLNLGISSNDITTYLQANTDPGYCAYIDNTTFWYMDDCETSQNLILCDYPPPTVDPTPMPTAHPTMVYISYFDFQIPTQYEYK